jgi:hypothetical protein
VDFTAVDTFLPHPVYRARGWVSIINPGGDTGRKVPSFFVERQSISRIRASRAWQVKRDRTSSYW